MKWKLLYNNIMQIKLKLTPKIVYLFSIIAVSVFLLYFAYSAIIAYLIHKELYGGGIDINSVYNFLSSQTLVGLLPVPHPIIIRTYLPNAYTNLWFTWYIWGVIFGGSDSWSSDLEAKLARPPARRPPRRPPGRPPDTPKDDFWGSLGFFRIVKTSFSHVNGLNWLIKLKPKDKIKTLKNKAKNLQK